MMKERCDREGHPRYARYGGRGITYDPRWADFVEFLSDMGERPSKYHSLERREYDKNYCKDNCFWATIEQQNNNKSNNHMVVVAGERMTLSQAVDAYGVRAHYFKINKKIHKGTDPLMAIEFYGGKRQESAA